MPLAPSFPLMAVAWTIAVSGAALACTGETSNLSSIGNLSCLFYDTFAMNCTWNISEQAPPDAQYHLFYKLLRSDNETNCTNYLKNGWRNAACHVEKFEITDYNCFRFCVAESSQNQTKRYCKRIVPVTYYKASPPINITVTENDVEWEPPEGLHHTIHFFYQIQITDWSNNVKKIEDVEFKWNIENQLKSYTVQLRARTNNFYSDSIWSDWSQPVNIVSKREENTFLKICVGVAVTFGVLVLLLMFICRRYKLLESLCQPIPDPTKMFKGLLDSTNADFQEWINAYHPVTKEPEECIVVTVED